MVASWILGLFSLDSLLNLTVLPVSLACSLEFSITPRPDLKLSPASGTAMVAL